MKQGPLHMLTLDRRNAKVKERHSCILYEPVMSTWYLNLQILSSIIIALKG